MLISGSRKARALLKVLGAEVSHMRTVSKIQLHQHSMTVCNDQPTMELKVSTVKQFNDIEGDNLGLPAV